MLKLSRRPRPSKLSEFQRQIDGLEHVSRIGNLNEAEKEFWQGQFICRLRGMHARIKDWQKWGHGLRLPALTAGAAVPALAPFSGIYVRIATAALAALAVALNGAATLLHTEQRLIINRRYEDMLLSTGWDFALERSPYQGDVHTSFKRFAGHVARILETYNTAYEAQIYTPPTTAPDHPAGDSEQSPPNNTSAGKATR